MPCNHCENTERAFDEISFSKLQELGSNGKNVFQCPYCSQRWFCYNDHFRLWGRVDDDLTWKIIISGIDYIPISIGSVCSVIPGYEEHAVDPASRICPKKNQWPVVKVEDILGNETVVMEWIGEYARGNIFKYRFAFPLMVPPGKLEGHPGSFQVPFIGQIKNWPNSEQREDMAKTFNDPEMGKNVAYLMSAKIPQGYVDGSIGPLGLVAEVVALGDPVVGIIRPQHFHDYAMIEFIMDEFLESSRD